MADLVLLLELFVGEKYHLYILAGLFIGNKQQEGFKKNQKPQTGGPHNYKHFWTIKCEWIFVVHGSGKVP